MTPATASELELLDFIRKENAKSLAWQQAAPNRFASLTEDSLEFIRERGYGSIAQYLRNDKECTFWDLYKEIHGVRPRHIRVRELSDEQLDSLLQDLYREHEAQNLSQQYESQLQEEVDLAQNLGFSLAQLIEWGVIEATAPWASLRLPFMKKVVTI